MRLRLLAPRYWLTWAGLGLLRVMALLPFPWMVRLGTLLGAVLRRLPSGFVRTARRNLELCFPELSPQARERLLDRHFASLGIALLEIPLAWWISPARLARIVHIEGAEHLRAAVGRGRGVILLTAHFTPMEMAGRALVSVVPGREREFAALCAEHGVPATVLGATSGDSLTVEGVFQVPLTELKQVWTETLPAIFG